MTRKRWLMVAAVVLALLLGGRMALRYLDWQASEAARSATGPVDIANLQALATSSCLCTRAKGDGAEEACWREYKAAIASHSVSGMATACEPISTALDCIATPAGEECIVTSYGNGICTAEEADAADRAWTQALDAEGAFASLDDAGRVRALKRADAAFKSVSEQIRRGERITSSSGPSSCG